MQELSTDWHSKSLQELDNLKIKADEYGSIEILRLFIRVGTTTKLFNKIQALFVFLLLILIVKVENKLTAVTSTNTQ